MTRFGHKLNYVINTFVKHTPGPDRISRNNMIRNESEGGLRMIKIRTFIKALKITWLCRLLINPKIFFGVAYQTLNSQIYFLLEMHKISRIKKPVLD